MTEKQAQKAMTLRLPDDLRMWLRMTAAITEETQNRIIIRAVRAEKTRMEKNRLRQGISDRAS